MNDLVPLVARRAAITLIDAAFRLTSYSLPSSWRTPLRVIRVILTLR